MTLPRPVRSLFVFVLSLSTFAIVANAQIKPGRDPNQPVDQEYTDKIREYTTAPYFNSPLTDYLPASSNVPTPKSVLGDVAGAPASVHRVEIEADARTHYHRSHTEVYYVLECGAGAAVELNGERVPVHDVAARLVDGIEQLCDLSIRMSCSP